MVESKVRLNMSTAIDIKSQKAALLVLAVTLFPQVESDKVT